MNFKSLLNQALADKVAAGEEIVIPSVVQKVVMQHPEEFSDTQYELAIKAANRWAKDFMRQLSNDDDSAQLKLPGVDLPSVLAIPAEGGDFVYRASAFCQWEEVVAAGKVRDDNVVKVQAKRDHYFEQMDLLRPYMEGTNLMVAEAVELMLGDAVA
jgi:hypothetical protein